jgi:hypothetical protein
MESWAWSEERDSLKEIDKSENWSEKIAAGFMRARSMMDGLKLSSL